MDLYPARFCFVLFFWWASTSFEDFEKHFFPPSWFLFMNFPNLKSDCGDDNFQVFHLWY